MSANHYWVDIDGKHAGSLVHDHSYKEFHFGEPIAKPWKRCPLTNARWRRHDNRETQRYFAVEVRCKSARFSGVREFDERRFKNAEAAFAALKKSYPTAKLTEAVFRP